MKIKMYKIRMGAAGSIVPFRKNQKRKKGEKKLVLHASQNA
jgi:hypothetical protein